MEARTTFTANQSEGFGLKLTFVWVVLRNQALFFKPRCLYDDEELKITTCPFATSRGRVGQGRELLHSHWCMLAVREDSVPPRKDQTLGCLTLQMHGSDLG